MKTKFYLASGVCAVSLALCMPLNAQLSPATTASPAASPASKPAARPIPFRGKISAVDQSAKTFNIGANQTFKVTDSTVITKGGNPATMADIVENEQARGTYLKQADGTLEAKTVRSDRKPQVKRREGRGRRAAPQLLLPRLKLSAGNEESRVTGARGSVLLDFMLRRRLSKQREDRQRSAYTLFRATPRQAVEAERMGEPWQGRVAQTWTTTLCRVRA